MMCMTVVMKLTMLLFLTNSMSSAVTASQQQQECDAKTDDKTTTGSTTTCNVGTTSCHSLDDTSICIYTPQQQQQFYRSGGTAMSYVPNQSLSTTICDQNDPIIQNTPYRTASSSYWWPYATTRSTVTKRHKASKLMAPTIQITFHIYKCQSVVVAAATDTSTSSTTTSKKSFWSYLFSSSSSYNDNRADTELRQCCCQPIVFDDRSGDSWNNANIELEVWQTRPDGSYPSIRDAIENKATGQCRTRYILSKDTTNAASNSNSNNQLQNHTASVTFRTVAPGSTGIFSGLGPNRFDLPPFGPPVLHVFLQQQQQQQLPHVSPSETDHIVPTLYNIPLSIHTKTMLQQKSTSDYRGAAWVQPKKYKPTKATKGNEINQGYRIRKWEPNIHTNHIHIDIDLFTPTVRNSTASSSSSSLSSTTSSSTRTNNNSIEQRQQKSLLFCPSTFYGFTFYGFPSSFFLEPIAICAPSLLNFFHL